MKKQLNRSRPLHFIPVLLLFIVLSARAAPVVRTDTVTLMRVDSLVTESDIKAGVEKTGNQSDRVRLSHRGHQAAGVACITCHHKNNNDDRIKQCARCHKGVKGQDAMHKACTTCHDQKKKGPVDCEACHKYKE